MKKVQNTTVIKNQSHIQPALHQKSREIQPYGTVIAELPFGLSVSVREQVIKRLNQILADTITINDLYKKSHWQTSGPTFYPLHLLFEKHYKEQGELVDQIAERIQLLGGISLAMGADVAEVSKIQRPPRGREEAPAQISRLLEAHQIILDETREAAEKVSDLGDEGTNDLLISDILRTNEMEMWFLYEHLVNMPLVKSDP
jgi:starvation-inducible DNA-binding protein